MTEQTKLGKIYSNKIFKWIAFGVFSGLAGGLGGVIFTFTLSIVDEFFWGVVNNLKNSGHLLIIPLIPFTGGLIVGILNYLIDREAFYVPCATDGMIDLVHRSYGYTHPKKPLLKIFTASITIGTGGSAGRECPMAYTGAGLGALVNLMIRRSGLGKLMKFTRRDSKIVAICGASGALGGIFMAPLGGGIFASEVLYSEDIEIEALPSAILASIIGCAIFSQVFGIEALVEFPKFHDMLIFNKDLIFDLFHVINMVLLGLISCLAGVLWVKVFYRVHYSLRDSKVPRPLRPALGALLDGLVIIVVLLLTGELYIWGMGYQFIQEAIYPKEFGLRFGQFALIVFIILYLGKILAGAFSIGSAGAGGVIVPTLFAGAMVGGAFAEALSWFFPRFMANDAIMSAYVVAGMAALYAAVGRVPMSTILLLCETCRNFSLFAPMFISSITAFMLAKRLNITIYPSQLPKRPKLTRKRRIFDFLLWFLIIGSGVALYFLTGAVI